MKIQKVVLKEFEVVEVNGEFEKRLRNKPEWQDKKSPGIIFPDFFNYYTRLLIPYKRFMNYVIVDLD